MNLARIQAAVKSAPEHRVMVEGLEVSGRRSTFKWEFDYIVRKKRSDGKNIVAYGRMNAEEYARDIPNDAVINSDVATFYYNQPKPVEKVMPKEAPAAPATMGN